MTALMLTTKAAVLAFWLMQGAAPPYAEALTRLAIRESGPLAHPPATGLGHCLYQWAGARWMQLQRYAEQWGCPSLPVQLAFANAELRSAYFGCFWRAPPMAAYAVLRRTFAAGTRCENNQRLPQGNW